MLVKFCRLCSWDAPSIKWLLFYHISWVQSLSRVRFFATPGTAALQAALSITSSRSLSKFMSIESVVPSNHLILCRILLLPPSIFPSIRVVSNESVLCIRWPKYWSFSCSHQSFQGTVWKGSGDPLQYSCLENSMDRGAWWAAVHEAAPRRTQLSMCAHPNVLNDSILNK